MHSASRRLSVSMAFGILVIMLLPMYADALTDTQQLITETIQVNPASDDNDEVVNIANETIPFNIDTWNPRPPGIFVGGTIEESLMRCTEVGLDSIYPGNELMIGTVMQFSIDYISSGASEFIVRLPMSISPDPAEYPYQVDLWIYELSAAQVSQWHFSGGTGGASHVMGVSHVGEVRAYVGDVANFHKNDATPETYPIYTSMVYNSWLIHERLYARVVAPIIAGEFYLFVAHAHVRVAVPFDIYWHPSDLCSDGLNVSRVGYSWNTDPASSYFRDISVSADAGWSFVFQVGLGNKARDWDGYFYSYSMLHFQKYVSVDRVNETGYAYGAFTFFMEFRTNSTLPFKYNLTVLAWDATGGGSTYVIHRDYWHDVDSHDIIIAGNPENKTVLASYSGGKYYVLLEVWLTVLIADRVQIMLCYDESSPDDSAQNYIEILRPYPGGGAGWWDGWLERELWFAPWCSASFSNSTWNRTDMVEPTNHNGFWSGVGRWWDKHWMDVVGGLMIIGGAFLILTGVGAGWGLALIAGGIALLLYNNVDVFRNAVDSILRMIIDGLTGLGNWLYKLGMMIWKALQWLVDKVMYFGSILIGLLLIGVAMALLVLPLYWEMKLLGAFEALVRGDVERAQRHLGEATGSMRKVAGVATGGRA